MLRKNIVFLFICLGVFLAPLESTAQYRSKSKRVKHRFNTGVIFGGNISQMDGDQYTGFDKAGLRGGLKGSMYLNQRLDVVVGLLFNQKGARFEGPPGYPRQDAKSRVIDLDYMEAPILLSVQMGENPRNGKGYVFETGFSYARLIDFDITEPISDPERLVSFTNISESFNRNEFNYILGLNYFFNQHLGIGIHYTFQMNRLYDNPLEREDTYLAVLQDDPATEIDLLRNYQLSVQLTYNIF